MQGAPVRVRQGEYPLRVMEHKTMKNSSILKRFIALNAQTVIKIPAKVVKQSRLSVVVRSA